MFNCFMKKRYAPIEPQRLSWINSEAFEELKAALLLVSSIFDTPKKSRCCVLYVSAPRHPSQGLCEFIIAIRNSTNQADLLDASIEFFSSCLEETPDYVYIEKVIGMAFALEAHKAKDFHTRINRVRDFLQTKKGNLEHIKRRDQAFKERYRHSSLDPSGSEGSEPLIGIIDNLKHALIDCDRESEGERETEDAHLSSVKP